jgi:processive 1,2-diacylglycerol beta-glucosyltransferase
MTAALTTSDRPDATSVRVLVLTAPVAEGHLAAARVLADDIRGVNADADVQVVDALPALPRPVSWFLYDAYRWQLGAAPWLFALLFGALERSRLLRRLSRGLLSLTSSRSLGRIVRRHRPDVVVSTWPAATMVLGSLRLRGKVNVPICATITDFAGLELWADRGVDLHLVMHQSLVPVVERVAGRGSAHVVSPLVSSCFRKPGSAVEARRDLDLPSDAAVVLVSGGGWGVGDLQGAAEAALEIGAFVVCLAGRDETTRVRLETAFRNDPRVRVLGFTERMSELLVAADVLVHSTGGVTCLEALTCGCPVVAYGAPPGHAPSGAQAMSALGLVHHVRSQKDLGTALTNAIRKPAVLLEQGVDAAQLVLRTPRRVAMSFRVRATRTAAWTCALAIGVFMLLASDTTYPLVAEALAFPETTSVSPAHDAVALVVEGNRADLLRLAALARRQDLHASVATSDVLDRGAVAKLRADGLDPLPELRAEGVVSWFEARRQLTSQVARYGLHGRFSYLAPREGFTFLGYLLAHHLGGMPVQGETDILGSRANLASVHAGEVLTATLGPARGDDPWSLLARVRAVERAGLKVSSIQRLRPERTAS